MAELFKSSQRETESQSEREPERETERQSERESQRGRQRDREREAKRKRSLQQMRHKTKGIYWSRNVMLAVMSLSITINQRGFTDSLGEEGRGV